MADNPSVNRPPSGTYGEGADLQRLRQSLPQGAIGNPGPAPPAAGPTPGSAPALVMPSPPGRPDTGGTPPPPGISPLLVGPTSRPGVPVNTPLQQGPVSAAVANPAQGRLQFLFMLANSPDVDAQTKEWAQVVLSHLIGPGAANAVPLIAPGPQGPPPQGLPPPPGPAPVVGSR